jgi:hypothetical protein
MKSQVYVGELILAWMNKVCDNAFCSPNFLQGEKLLWDLGGLTRKIISDMSKLDSGARFVLLVTKWMDADDFFIHKGNHLEQRPKLG